MSILIKMEMPKNCTECNFDAGGYCLAKSLNFLDWCEVNDRPRPSWCPLIEVPKHGRWELYNNTGMGFSHRCSLCGFAVRERWIGLYKFCPQCGAEMEDDDAPTIIEAEPDCTTCPVKGKACKVFYRDKGDNSVCRELREAESEDDNSK